MSSARLIPTNDDDDDDNDNNSLSHTGVIIKDIFPRSMQDGKDDDCLCTCSCCPTLFGWCVKDAIGLSCCFLISLFFLYGQFVFIFVLLSSTNYSLLSYYINLIVFHCIEFLAISCYFRTMFSNPGTVPLNDATQERLLNYEDGTILYRCAKCQSIRPPRAHHCSVCKRCVKRMDHHCVFVNNCVGENNQKYFILFTFYTFILTVHGLLCDLLYVTTCVKSNWTECSAWSPPATMLFVISVGLLAFAFMTFTGIMTGIQLYTIYADKTQIEFFKGVVNLNTERNSFMYSLEVVFGSPMNLNWLNPFSKPNYPTNQCIRFTV